MMTLCPPLAAVAGGGAAILGAGLPVVLIATWGGAVFGVVASSVALVALSEVRYSTTKDEALDDHQ